MTAIMNGISLHGGFIVYGGTFLVFSDYARNAVRLGCLMSLRVILVYTHDSIGLGEDGPTHQPIEHLSSLRAMPHMRDRKSTRLNSSHSQISYAVFCLKKKKRYSVHTQL